MPPPLLRPRPGGRAVFLDRDGVINRNVYYASSGEWESPRKPEDFELLPGALDALERLQELEVSTFIVSNQPSHAKGKTSLEALQRVHERLLAQLEARHLRLAGAYYCWHHPAGTVPPFASVCECRKPSPFFLLNASREHHIDLVSSWMIGDRATDVECGRRAGTRTILVGEGGDVSSSVTADFRAASLLEAVTIIADNFSADPR